MHFALIGDDREVWPLLTALQGDPHDQLVSALYVEDSQAELGERFPRLQFPATPDELIADPRIAVAIIAGDSARVLEAARQLAAAGKSIASLVRVGQGEAYGYELSFAAEDHDLTLFPILPLRHHPLVAELRNLLQTPEWSQTLHWNFERGLRVQPAEGQPPLMALAAIDAVFFRDVDLLRYLSGDYKQITALYSGGTADLKALATVTLAGESSQTERAPATWVCRPAPESHWTLSIGASAGTLVLSGTASGEVRLELRRFQGKPETQVSQSDSGAETWSALQRALARTPVDGDPAWRDAERGFELVSALHDSLRRRRTIDLFRDAPNERSQFKSQMTAVGCCLLILTLFTTLGALVVGAMAAEFDWPPWVMVVVRATLWGPLVAFLLVQVLVIFTRAPVRRASSQAAANSPTVTDS